MATDVKEIKQHQQKSWSAGDYAQIAKQFTLTSELLCESAGVLPHHRVLDVATGNGNTALIAAHRNTASVTGIDFAPELIEHARTRAQVEGLGVTFEVGDAEELPYPNGSFDIVLSTFGVMFTPDQEQAARELVRVCRPGGRIGLANWTPDSLPGQFLKIVGSYVSPPPGLQPPVLWGTEFRLQELFGDRVDLDIARQDVIFRALSAEHYVRTYCRYFGPLITALSRVEEADQQRLIHDLEALVSSFARSAEESVEIPGSYLQVIATVR